MPPTPIQLYDDQGLERFSGKAVGGGGSQPVVTCQLLTAALDISAQANYALLWNAIQDNPWDENTLLAIPAGLGITFAFDGTNNLLTMTEAGTWAFSLALLGGTVDLDWRGRYDDGLWGQSRIVPAAPGGAPSLIATAVMTMPSGAQLLPSVDTDVAAAATQTMAASLLVSRLA